MFYLFKAAFWATNPNNTFVGNAVAGSSHFGYWYRLLDRPDGPSFTPNYCPKKIPMGMFFNNSAHGCGRFGLWIFPGYHPTQSGSCLDTNSKPAKFEHFHSYSCDKGAEWVNSNPLQFRHFTVFDHASSGIETKTIFSNLKENTEYVNTFYSNQTGPLIADTVIIGNSDTSQGTSITESGLVVAWDRGQLLQSVSFYNFPSEGTRAIRGPFIIGTCT